MGNIMKETGCINLSGMLTFYTVLHACILYSPQYVCSHGILFNSSLNDQHIVYRGENITFQCITIGSSILAWSSNEYIGDRIEFLNVHRIGTIVTPNDYTSAVLIDAYSDQDGQAVIVSLLSIIVQRGIISQSSVTCHHVGSGDTETVSFQLSNTPVLTCSGRNVCPGEFRNFSCEIRDSSILAWENDQYIGGHGSRLEFLSFERVGTVKFSEVNHGVFANLTGNYYENGVQVLKCELSVSKFQYHPDDVEVVCVNVGLSTENSYRISVNYSCNTTTIGVDGSVTSNTTTNWLLHTVGDGTAKEESGAPIVIIVPVIIISLAMLLLSCIAVILIAHKWKKEDVGYS